MKIALLLSGGVDSSVALHILKQQGHDITAFYLKIWLEDEVSSLGKCPWEDDLLYVRKVCKQLSVSVRVISLQKEYWELVVSYVLSSVRSGKTPNPDILCNSLIKFGAFLDIVGDEFDKIASGHYAQVYEKNRQFFLKRSPDAVKDQTYFLSQLSQEQLRHALFPIGHLTKMQVRSYARQLNLPNKDRKDSQGICFLGSFKFRDFLYAHLGEKKGKLIEYETGKVLGEHNGFWFFTIGQRHGIGLADGPWYVVAKKIEDNIVYISCNYYDDKKKRNIFTVKNCNWITCKPEHFDLKVKLRHGAALYSCKIMYDRSDKSVVRVMLHENDQGIAAGQFAVFYDKELCVGAGIIKDDCTNMPLAIK